MRPAVTLRRHTEGMHTPSSEGWAPANRSGCANGHVILLQRVPNLQGTEDLSPPPGCTPAQHNNSVTDVQTHRVSCKRRTKPSDLCKYKHCLPNVHALPLRQGMDGCTKGHPGFVHFGKKRQRVRLGSCASWTPLEPTNPPFCPCNKFWLAAMAIISANGSMAPKGIPVIACGGRKAWAPPEALPPRANGSSTPKESSWRRFF